MYTQHDFPARSEVLRFVGLSDVRSNDSYTKGLGTCSHWNHGIKAGIAGAKCGLRQHNIFLKRGELCRRQTLMAL